MLRAGIPGRLAVVLCVVSLWLYGRYKCFFGWTKITAILQGVAVLSGLLFEKVTHTHGG